MTISSHGFLILDKPMGITSAKAVSQVKRLLKCDKIGHGGTLDPLASGVLPLAIGEATKAFSYVVSSQKKYRFTVTFGEERSTGDAEGEASTTTDVMPTQEDIQRVLPEFIGTIMQTPPIYSAISIGGKRAYELARAGEQVEMIARPVEIYDLKLLSFEMDSRFRGNDKKEGGYNKKENGNDNITIPEVVRGCSGGVLHDDPGVSRGGAERGRDAPLKLNSDSSNLLSNATFQVKCGKGTYVRSLGQDIARKCNSLGYISMLRRVAVGRFHEKNAISLDKLAELVYKPADLNAWVPIELALDDIPAIDMNPEQTTLLRYGQTLRIAKPDGNYMVLTQGHILALAEIKGGLLRSTRLFNI